MNPNILMVIDHHLNPDKYTRAQLQDNADADNAAAYIADNAAANAAAYTAANAFCVATDAAADAVYWLNKYFNITGENKQDYIDAINKDNKQ